MADLSPTRILAFDFDLCVCDGEGFFELFTQLLDIYEFCQQRRNMTDKHTGGLPEDFMEMVEKAYKTLALDAAAASKRAPERQRQNCVPLPQRYWVAAAAE